MRRFINKGAMVLGVALRSVALSVCAFNRRGRRGLAEHDTVIFTVDFEGVFDLKTELLDKEGLVEGDRAALANGPEIVGLDHQRWLFLSCRGAPYIIAFWCNFLGDGGTRC
jgi:hypothetical protein